MTTSESTILRDAEIADIVIPLERSRNDRKIVRPVIDLLAEVDEIIARLAPLRPQDQPDEEETRQLQLDYANALRAVYVDALARRTH